MSHRKFAASLALLSLSTQIIFPSLIYADNIDHPQIYSQPIIKWGNSSYHDSLGARDPFVVKDQGTYYLYYDCTEDLLNPSFESNLGANGWDTWKGTATSESVKKLFGDRSLKVSNLGTEGGGAYTGNYYFGSHVEANLAMPGGLEVTPNTTYIASAYVWASPNDTAKLIVQQYKEDSDQRFYWQNLLPNTTTQSAITGNNEWQRIFVKFTTSTNASAITLSLVPGLNQTSYWDGIQLERIENNITDPSPFPTDQKYNERLEDTIGWRSCLATSTDGINFQKKGQLSITGPKGDFEDNEKPGWVGSSAMYISPFFYQDYWYSYTWVSGYKLGTPVSTQDLGGPNHGQYYGDRRAFLPIGTPTRSGLIRSKSLTGPFERVSREPVVSPRSSTSWGQLYITTNGVPQKINNQWVLFLAGTASPTLDSSWWRTITPGLAVGDNPLGPWTVTDYSPLISPNYPNEVPEGPIYYLDRSGKHFMFINNIAAGTAIAHWTDNPLSPWPPSNQKTLVNRNQTPWSPNGAEVGLSTVVEKDSSTLLLYFATRPNTTNTNSWNRYLFHDIGLATFSLPLLNYNLPGDLNKDNKVNLFDYNELVSKWNKPYTNLDYQNILTNFGK